MKKIKIFSMGAIILAALLICGSIPGLIPLLGGTRPVVSGSELTARKYVSFEMNNVVGIYADTYSPIQPKKVTGYIVVTWLGDQLVSVRLPARMMSGAEDILTQTEDYYYNGSAIASYISIRGTVVNMNDKMFDLLYNWCGDNVEWLNNLGMNIGSLGQTWDLSGFVVKADYVGIYPSMALLLTVLGCAVFLILAAVGALMYERNHAAKLKAAEARGKKNRTKSQTNNNKKKKTKK